MKVYLIEGVIIVILLIAALIGGYKYEGKAIR